MHAVNIVLFLFFALLFGLNLYQYRRKSLEVRPFIIWSACLLFLMLLSLFPEPVMDSLMGVLGFKFRDKFFLIALSVLVFSFFFSQLHANNVARRNFKSMHQQLGLLDFCKENGLDGRRKEKKSDVLVKIAAYNEAANLEGLLPLMPSGVDVLIIDDGSMDETRATAERLGAMCLRHPVNMGQGTADMTGFAAAFELDYDYVVEMDADLQHDPADIPRFVQTLKDEPGADIVVGSRILGSQDNAASAMRTYFLPKYTRLINWATGYTLTDGLCGFKAYRMASLGPHRHLLWGLLETEYVAAEMYIRFSRAGLKVREIPIHVALRRHGRSRKGTIRYGLAVAWIILRTWLDRR